MKENSTALKSDRKRSAKTGFTGAQPEAGFNGPAWSDPVAKLERHPARAASLDLLDLMAMARLTAAGNARRHFTCAIINVKSGRCGEDCAFCAQSGHYNTGAAIYPMMPVADILDEAARRAGWGVEYLGLVASGGRLGDKDFNHLLTAAAEIKKRFDLKLCASVGTLEAGRAAALKSAGFTSCHHNLETGPGFFNRVCGTHSLAARVETVKAAQKAGLRTCSGGIFGLGENWRDRLELAELLNGLKVDSIPINFLMPIPGTPLGGRAPLPAAEALRLIAIMRLVNPKKDLIICGGRETALGPLKNMCQIAGANGLMIGDYLTATGSSLKSDLAALAALELK